MRVWEVQSFDISGLAMADRPSPVPGPNEVLVDIEAVSLNFRDIAIVSGVYAPDQALPLIPASDAAGTISAVGPHVDDWQVGDRVIGSYMQDWQRGESRRSDTRFTLGSPLDGVLCEQRIFPKYAIVKAPNQLSCIECATLPIAALTAWCALFEKADGKAGQTVLVQGSGGVSTFAIYLATAAGMNVIALSRSAQKLERTKDLGAAHTVDISVHADWATEVFRLTDGVGVDIILDVAGQATIGQSVAAAAQNGRIVLIGFLGGVSATIDLGPLIVKNLTVKGITVGSRASFENMLRFIALSGIRPVIDDVFPFSEAPQAFARLASGEQQGKICITIGE